MSFDPLGSIFPFGGPAIKKADDVTHPLFYTVLKYFYVNVKKDMASLIFSFIFLISVVEFCVSSHACATV